MLEILKGQFESDDILKFEKMNMLITISISCASLPVFSGPRVSRLVHCSVASMLRSPFNCRAVLLRKARIAHTRRQTHLQVRGFCPERAKILSVGALRDIRATFVVSCLAADSRVTSRKYYAVVAA